MGHPLTTACSLPTGLPGTSTSSYFIRRLPPIGTFVINFRLGKLRFE